VSKKIMSSLVVKQHLVAVSGRLHRHDAIVELISSEVRLERVTVNIMS